jgi:hypothetical protein
MPASQIKTAATGTPGGLWFALALLTMIGIAIPLWSIRRLLRAPR